MSTILQISSNSLNNPKLIEILYKLTTCFQRIDMSFCVIGATARDIIIKQLSGSAPFRRTRDLDIAIAIPSWDRFAEVETVLVDNGFKKSRHARQRFFLDDYEIDIVPFGTLAKADDKIYWPPEEDIAMSVKGFYEILDKAITLIIDDDLEVRIVSLPGLFVLKFYAWQDRHLTSKKDADDMGLVLRMYFELNNDRNFHPEVYDEDDFEMLVAGGIWLAYDIASLLPSEQLISLSSEIKEELDKEERSILLNQILETNPSITYESLLRALKEIVSILIEIANTDKG